MIRSALAIIFLMFLILSDFANAKGKIPTAAYIPKAQTVLPGGTLTKAEVQTVDNAAVTCEKRALLARKLCLEEFNPDIQAAMPIITALTVATSNMVDACSKMGEAMKIANAALTAYNISCSAAKVACDTACGTATKFVQTAPEKIVGIALNAKTACAGATCPEEAAAIAANNGAIPAATKEIAALKEECAGHAQRLTTASVGLLSVIAAGNKANKCEEDTTTVDCNLNPTDASCVANIDCSVAANATKTVCICAKSPNSAGCAGAGLAGGGDYSQSMAATADAAEKMGNMNPSGSYSGDLISPNGGGSAAGGGIGAGGSGSGGGGVGGGSAAKGTGKSADGKALNTNILSGYEGGGGGGGGRSGSGSSGSDYDQYLPGGKKDPSRNVASQVFANGQVTGGGGKSNWEKVKDRYRDNRPKLMTGP